MARYEVVIYDGPLPPRESQSSEPSKAEAEFLALQERPADFARWATSARDAWHKRTRTPRRKAGG